MAAITANAGSNNWNTNGAWVGGVQPTTADDVTIPAAAIVTIPAATTVQARSVTVAAAGTWAFAATTSVINIGDGTTGLGNVALSIDSTAIITLTGIGTINFISTSATVQTITSGGKILPNWTINGIGNSYSLADSNTVGTTTVVTLAAGTLNTNSQTCSWGGFNSSSSGVRTLTLGASSIAITGNTWLIGGTLAQIALNAGTSTITLSGVSAALTTQSQAFTFNNVIFSGSGVAILSLSSAGATFANLTRIGTSAKTDSFLIASVSSTIITGTLTVTGNSAINRILVQSNTIGSMRAFTAAAVSLTNVDFMDIAAAGASAPWTGTSLGDALGNSGIIFDAPVAQTWQGTSGGNWSNVSKWTSRVPLPQDNVVFASAFAASQTVVADMPRLGADINWTGSSGNPTWHLSIAVSIYGSVNLTNVGSMTTAITTSTLAGRGSHTITCAGKVFTMYMNLNAPGGTYTLQDNCIINNMLASAGTFTANNFNVTLANLQATATGVTINMGSGIWTLTTATIAAIWNVNTLPTINAGTSTIVISSAASSLARTFVGGSKTYHNLTYAVANSPGPLVITGANTFTTLNIGSGRTLTMPSSTVNTIASGGTFNVNGVNNGYLYLPGSGLGTVNTPDSAAVSVTGDIDIQILMKPSQITAASDQLLVTKSYGGGWWFILTPAGNLYFGFRNVVMYSVNSGYMLTGADISVMRWYRVTRVQSTGLTSFYTSLDGNTWTSVGTPQNIAAGISLLDDATTLQIGAADAQIGRARMYNGISGSGGILVFDADFATKPFGANSFPESSTNAATVTINGALAQAGDGRVVLNSSVPGTPAILSKSSGTTSVDYLTIQDSTATGGAAWYAGANSVDVSGNSGWIFGALGATATKAANFLTFFGGSF